MDLHSSSELETFLLSRYRSSLEWTLMDRFDFDSPVETASGFLEKLAVSYRGSKCTDGLSPSG